MSQTEETLAVAASKRLKMDGRSILSLMSMVDNALNNLARQTANDSLKRFYLMTDPTTTTVSITTSGFSNIADLAPVIDVPQVMVDNLQYGTVFYNYPVLTFPYTKVVALTSLVQISGHNFTTGMPIQLGNITGIISGVVANQTYYAVVPAPDYIGFAYTLADALAGTLIPITAGSSRGDATITAWTNSVAQWLQSPNQSLLNQPVPFNYTYVWLEGTVLYTNQSTGTFGLNVPFIPTVDTLPPILESDAIDQIVTLAMSSGFEPLTIAQQ